MTNLTTRRSLLASMPAVAATMTPGATTALGGLPQGAADDPIFALIAEHREAIRGETAAYLLQAHAEETTPHEQRSWSYRAGNKGPPPAGCTDPPEWIASQIAVMNACDRSSDAELAVLTTPPVTLAGVIALLDHVSLPAYPDEPGSEGNETILENASDCYRDDIEDAAANFLPMIAETLRKLIAA